MRHEEQLLSTIQALKTAQPITWRITVASALSLSNDPEIATFGQSLGQSLQSTAATQSEARHERTDDEINQFVDGFLSQRNGRSYI
jgi:hypothetical protein